MGYFQICSLVRILIKLLKSNKLTLSGIRKIETLLKEQFLTITKDIWFIPGVLIYIKRTLLIVKAGYRLRNQQAQTMQCAVSEPLPGNCLNKGRSLSQFVYVHCQCNSEKQFLCVCVQLLCLCLGKGKVYDDKLFESEEWSSQ